MSRPPNLVHVTVSVRGRQALARDEAERRALVRALVEVRGEELLLFNVVDDHLHAVLRVVRSTARLLARGMRHALAARRPELELKPPHIEPVTSRAHLHSLVPYVLSQPVRHGLAHHPAMWSGSSFPDQIGARLLRGFDRRLLREELPRLRGRDLFEAVGLDAAPLERADDAALRRAGAARLAEACASVFGVGPALEGRDAAVGAARVLLVEAALGVGLTVEEVARALELQPRWVRRLARRRSLPGADRALRLRLALEERVRLPPRPLVGGNGLADRM